MESTLKDKQDVQEILKSLKGLEPLKELFWTRLSYKRVDIPISRESWSETARNALAEDPLLWASSSNGGAFHIIYSRLDSEQLLLGMERPVVTTLLREHPYALFVFSNETQNRWHFLNVKYDDDEKKRQLFRRITVGPEERYQNRLRTASDRIEMLDLAKMGDTSPLLIQSVHDEAFDVEKVTKEFFKEFASLYHKVKADIEKFHPHKEKAGKLAQQLLDRLLFLYFIQKKGWLNQEYDYLYQRFLVCYKQNPGATSYYSEVLAPLFQCLSNPDEYNDAVGHVPFLNGGLFEDNISKNNIERLQADFLQVRNSTFKEIFDNLLERFNFTVTEDTPFDVEVAIDPEMLGKIFESLILQLEKNPRKDLRKLTGSYYTPRSIVHFMCQYSLKEYLVDQIVEDDDLSKREKTSASILMN